MSAADRLAAFIEREKSGDDSDWQYDPRPDIETLLAALSRVEQERDEARRALDVYADYRHWAIERPEFEHPKAIWIGPGADAPTVPHPTRVAEMALSSAAVGREDA
jgi:hypothetical protein